MLLLITIQVEKLAREAKYQADCVFENLVRIGKGKSCKAYTPRKFHLCNLAFRQSMPYS